MLKKFLSAFAAFAILLHSFLPVIVFAVTTDGQSNPWTLQKAEHLARKVYFAATDANVRELYDAGSALAAVNKVFPDQTGPSRAQFETEIAELTGSGFNWGDGGHMARLYQMRYARDPYESKVKLRSLFEDIFSVNQSDQILHRDIINQHDLLHTYTLGNYKTLVKKILFNNGSPGDYPTGKFLDLLDQSNKNYPNENYSRELLQLFLMGEYYPTESKEAGDIRNYEESDVQSLAKILTGFVSDATTHTVSYDPTKHNTSTGILFLNGAIKPGVNFGFIDGSGALDLGAMAMPMSGNNGLADNSLDYIFAARERAIAGFLADRIFRFYVHNSPTRAQIDAVADTIVAENFEILPVVKSLLSSDVMYSDASMNTVTFKNPLELAIGTSKLLHSKTPERIDPMLRDTQLLARLNWTPFFPGSIFGRDGFDDNAKFYSTYIQNQWITYSNRIAYDTASGAYSLEDIVPYTHTGITQDLAFSRFTQMLSGSLQVESGSVQFILPTSTGSVSSGSTLSGTVSNLSISTASSITENLSATSISGSTISSTETPAQVSSSSGSILSETTQTSSGTSSSNTGAVVLPDASATNISASGSEQENNSGSILPPGPTPEELAIEEKKATGMILGNTGSTDTGTTLTPGMLSLTGGIVSLANMTVMTALGLLQLNEGTYSPSTKTFLVRSGTLGTGTGILMVNSGSIQFTQSSNITRDISPEELIGFIEKTLLVSRTLPSNVKSSMVSYLTTGTDGNPAVFLPSNTSFQNTRIKGVIAMVLMQPEYVMQTGFDLPTIPLNSANSVLANTQSKLLFVELGGGYDWLHGVIPKAEYAEYVSKRTNSGGSIVIDSTRVVDIDDLYLNRSLAYGSGGSPSLKSLHDSGNLRIFNRVGAPKHSRDHDQAQKQIASYLAITNDEADGVFGQLIKYEPSSESTISLSGKKPNVFRNGRFINIGPSGALFQNSYLSQSERTKQLSSIRSILQSRDYPATTSGLFTSAVRIDEIAQISRSTGGPDGAGYGNVNNLNFLRTLLANNVGKTFFMQGDGGYDTHSNQLAPQSNFDAMNIPKDLNYNIGRVVSNLTTFFNDVKATQDITIVVFSEFGRTTEVNGDLGTDHGQGGGMFVISNNARLLSSLGQKNYGNMSIKNAESNWLGVGIDYRAVYGKIYSALYGVSDTSHFGVVKDLATEVSQVPANFKLMRSEFKALNDGSASVRLKLRMEGDNFNSTQASYISGSWQKDPNQNNSEMRRIDSWQMNNSYEKPNNEYHFNRDWINPGRTLQLDMKAFTNQYSESVKSFSATVPRIVRSSFPAVVTGTGNIIFRKYDSTSVSSTGTLLSGSGVVLADLPLPYIITSTGSTGSGTTSSGTLASTGATLVGSGASMSGVTLTESLIVPSLTLESSDGIRLTMTGGITAVQNIFTTSGTGIWNGGFILGENISADDFVSKDALIRGTTQKLQEQGVEKLVRIGADTLGIGMQLNQPVRVSIPVSVDKPYRLYSSEDGLLWTAENNGLPFTASGGRLDFMTPHFTYFALTDGTAIPPPSCNIVASQSQVTNGSSVTLSWGSTHAISARISPSLGNVTLSGSTLVVPPNDTGTPYILTVGNVSNVTSTCQVIVTAVGVTMPPGTATGTTGTGVVVPPITHTGTTNTGIITPPTTPAPNPNSNVGAPVPSGGGGSGLPILSVFNQDICPGGDLSGSKFDGKCLVNGGVTEISTDKKSGTGAKNIIEEGLDGKITAKGLRVPNIKSKDIKKLVPSKAPKTEVKSMQERVAETQATLQIIEDARTVDIAPVQKNAEKKKVVVSKLDEALLLGMQQLLFTSDTTLSGYNWSDGRRLPYAVYSILDARMSTVITAISEQDGSSAYVARLESALRKTAQTSTNFEQRKMAEYYLTELFIASRKVSVR